MRKRRRLSEDTLLEQYRTQSEVTLEFMRSLSTSLASLVAPKLSPEQETRFAAIESKLDQLTALLQHAQGAAAGQAHGVAGAPHTAPLAQPTPQP